MKQNFTPISTREVRGVLSTCFVALMPPPNFVFPVFFVQMLQPVFYGLFSVSVYFCLQIYS